MKTFFCFAYTLPFPLNPVGFFRNIFTPPTAPRLERPTHAPGSFCNLNVSRGEKCSFFGKFGVLRFLQTHVLRFTFLLYYRQTM